MSTELVKVISVRPGGVYIYSKSNNDDFPYREWRSDSLSNVFASEGQKGLDREFAIMFAEYANVVGNHPSVERYRSCAAFGRKLLDGYWETVMREHSKLSPADIATLDEPEDSQTDAAKAYNAAIREAEANYRERLTRRAALLTER